VQTSHATISPLNKGLGSANGAVGPEEIAKLNWNLLREDLSLPVAVLYQEKLAHNLQWMQRFIAAYGMKLAPHGKTTMAPKLFAMQLDGGAWGITVATAHQALVAHSHGVRRVLMANQLVGRQNMEIVSGLLRDPGFEYFCLVDSTRQVDLLHEFFRGKKQRVQVLLEVGATGGRTGIRTDGQLQELLEALGRCRQHVALSGVEVFEGVFDDENRIRELLHRVVTVTKMIADGNRFDRDPIVLSGAGSSWYDVVAEIFSAAEIGKATEIVLRPGCYLTHDAGGYKTAQERILAHNPIAQQMHSGLTPALHLWAYVQSIPETECAIVALGKRDVAFDSGLPAPVLHYRPGSPAPVPAAKEWKVTRLMDQHAYLQIQNGDNIQIGDMIGFDISHPCLTFDKWRYLPILDNDYRVVDIVQTYF
jgi:D-serine dehydratase